MTATPRPLRHALFTNAASAAASPAGYRMVRLPEGWPSAGVDRLERWLVALAGGGARAAAVATGAIRLGGVLHAALARVDPSFGSDRLGRGGALVHAVVTPLDEDRPLADDVYASLLTASRRFARLGAVGGGGLEAYLDACRARVSYRPSALDADRLLRLDRSAWRAILAAAAAPRGTLSLAATADALPDLLVAATAPLPPRLRLAFRWQVGGAPPSAGTVRVASGPAAGGDGGGPGDTIHRWLEARARARDVAALRALAGDWTIRSWDALAASLGNGEGAGRQR